MKKIIQLFSSSLIVMVLAFPLTTFAVFTSECTGGVVTYSGGRVIHTFTSSGTFDCTSAGSGSIDVLVVAGGGGAGSTPDYTGGGGAGGYVYNSGYNISAQSYSVTVGAGGGPSTNGSNSIFDSIVANGGGKGGDYTVNGSSGGSGGGGGGQGGTTSGGTGTIGQGNNGGSGGFFGVGRTAGGGGGGAGATGMSVSSPNGGNGGIGIANSITGSSVYYAGGGGGGVESGTDTPGNGGLGGGGNGGAGGLNNGSSGSANTGGGGGGGSGSGGSGIVIMSYSTSTSPSYVSGTGSVNRLSKFVSTTTLSDSLLSDDGSNITLTSGNLFMPASAIIDTITSGALNFGTTYSTNMTFGRSGQNIIINSKVGISTSTPATELQVNGTFLANIINVIANGLGIDTYSTGTLYIGSTTATAINIGRLNATTTISGPLKVTNLNTVSNCSSTSTPASCGSAVSGSVAMPTGGSTLIVNTSAVTANSQIFITEDSSLGSRLGITCNTTTGRVYSINARNSTSSPSFTIKSSANPSTNKACLSYFIVN